MPNSQLENYTRDIKKLKKEKVFILKGLSCNENKKGQA